jgi:hypothetical protein
MLCLPRWRRIGLLALVSMLFCYCLNDVLIKNLVMRPRPLYSVENLVPLVPVLSSSSFASGTPRPRSPRSISTAGRQAGRRRFCCSYPRFSWESPACMSECII